ncbi:MAG: hypothetical protein JHC20_03750 [Pyrobaculum sp.]|nr:hypothetical protein [Pyrobaculum sp.]
MLTLSLTLKERLCTRRFLRLGCTSETPKTGPEGLGKMRHVKDRVADTLLSNVGTAALPFAVLVSRGVRNGVYPLDVSPLFVALIPWAILWMFLVFMLEFRAYRYAEGLSFRETLQKLLYEEKKFGSTVFQFAAATLAMYWFFNWLVYIMKNPSPDRYHVLVALFVSVATPVVLAVVVGWALDVLTRRLFGEALGKFLFAAFIAGAVFHPLLGVVTSFLFSWAMFGRARDAAVAAAVSALSLFAVVLPGLIWTSVFLL